MTGSTTIGGSNKVSFLFESLKKREAFKEPMNDKGTLEQVMTKYHYQLKEQLIEDRLNHQDTPEIHREVGILFQDHG